MLATLTKTPVGRAAAQRFPRKQQNLREAAPQLHPPKTGRQQTLLSLLSFHWFILSSSVISDFGSASSCALPSSPCPSLLQHWAGLQRSSCLILSFFCLLKGINVKNAFVCFFSIFCVIVVDSVPVIPAAHPAATATTPWTQSNDGAQFLISPRGTFQRCFQRLSSYLCRNVFDLQSGLWESAAGIPRWSQWYSQFMHLGGKWAHATALKMKLCICDYSIFISWIWKMFLKYCKENLFRFFFFKIDMILFVNWAQLCSNIIDVGSIEESLCWNWPGMPRTPVCATFLIIVTLQGPNVSVCTVTNSLFTRTSASSLPGHWQVNNKYKSNTHAHLCELEHTHGTNVNTEPRTSPQWLRWLRSDLN